MSTFDESKHPRETGGQFATKANDAPTGALTGDARAAQLDEIEEAYGHRIWSHQLQALQLEKRVHEDTVERLMADAAAHAPKEATAAVFGPNDSGDGVELFHFVDGDGDAYDASGLTGDGSYTLDDISHERLRDLGFEISYVDGGSHVGPLGEQWTLPLRDPVAPSRPIVPDAGNHAPQTDYLDRRAGGDGGLGAFLHAVIRRHDGIDGALITMNGEQLASINRDFEAYAALVAKRLRDINDNFPGGPL